MNDVKVLAPPRSNTGLRIGLWVAQVLLAAVFGMAGFMKLTTPSPELSQMMPVPLLLARFIGASELAGALGLLLPSLTRVKPRLTPLAAVGLVTVMILAAAFHLSRGEAKAVPMNLILGGLAAFVAWGRSKKAPIAPRS